MQALGCVRIETDAISKPGMVSLRKTIVAGETCFWTLFILDVSQSLINI